MNYPNNLTDQYLEEAINKLIVAKGECVSDLKKYEIEAAIYYAKKARNKN